MSLSFFSSAFNDKDAYIEGEDQKLLGKQKTKEKWSQQRAGDSWG